MHNYQSNQSALMTRCGTDFRHQYGIFDGESQTSFTRNATRAGSEEGRLFSQATRETPLGPGAKKDGCFRRLGLPVLDLARGRELVLTKRSTASGDENVFDIVVRTQ